MKEMEQWINWGKQNKKMIFFYEQQVLDLTQFASIHPGGRKALSSYLYKDITDILFAVYPHKKGKTLETLNKYVIGTNLSFAVGPKLKKQSVTTNKQNRSKKKVCFEPSSTSNQPVQQVNLKNTILPNSIKKSKIQNTRSKKPQSKENTSKSKKYQVSLTIIPDKPTFEDMTMIKKTSKSQREDIDSHIKQSQMEESNNNIVIRVFNVKMNKEH